MNISVQSIAKSMHLNNNVVMVTNAFNKLVPLHFNMNFFSRVASVCSLSYTLKDLYSCNPSIGFPDCYECTICL